MTRNNTKRALIASLLSLLLCCAMLVGTTFAWFTDSVKSGSNKIVAGNLAISATVHELEEWGTDLSNTAVLDCYAAYFCSYEFMQKGGENGLDLGFAEEGVDFEDNADFMSDSLFEPGKTYVKMIEVKNDGSLAAKVKLHFDIKDGGLQDALWFAISVGQTEINRKPMAELNEALEEIEFSLRSGEDQQIYFAYGMNEDAGNEYQGKSFEAVMSILATQDTYEKDSFGSDYDAGAEYPGLKENTVYLNGTAQAEGTTIQSVIDSAKDGDVISLGNGTYTEALKIEGKHITIKGASSLGTYITFTKDTEIPVVAAVNGESQDYNGIITANNATLVLENITVKGNIDDAYPKMYNNRYAGVFALDSDVTMTNCRVEDIRPTDNVFGVQNGNAVYAVSSSAKTLTLTNVVIDNFQKTGILTRENVTLYVDGGSITGIGETALTAQNGIQYSGPATIKNVTISDIYYTGNASAVALFAYPFSNAASTVDNVTVRNCQYDITVYSAGTVTVTNSNIETIQGIAAGATLTFDGVEQQGD